MRSITSFLLGFECDGQCFAWHAYHRACSAGVCLSKARSERASRLAIEAEAQRRAEIEATGQ